MKTKIFTLFLLLLINVNFVKVWGITNTITIDSINGIWYAFDSFFGDVYVTENPSYSSRVPSYSGDIVIPQTVTYCDSTYVVNGIGDDAFNQCSSLTSISIPNSVTSIGDHAFDNCTGLTSVSIGSGLISIGSYAFRNCTSLTSVTLPNSVRHIKEYAFYMCQGFTSIVIPANVLDVGKYAFAECDHLETVTWNAENCANLDYRYKSSVSIWTIPENPYFEQSSSSIKTIVFGNNVKHIPNALCCGFSAITSVIIPENVNDIGKDAFNNCEKLSIIEWNAKNYTKIYWDNNNSMYTPFYSEVYNGYLQPLHYHNPAPYIKKIIIGQNVEGIDHRVFYGMDNVEMVICKNSTPPSILSFFRDFTSSVPLCVPEQSIDLYKSTEPWKHFKYIIPLEAQENNSNIVSVTPTDSSVVIMWPAHVDADIYDIKIMKSENVGGDLSYDCHLIFDENGFILSAAFAAPMRNGEIQKKQKATLTETGWRYEFYDLEMKTQYTYTITARDVNDSILYSSIGEFLTPIKTFTITFINWDNDTLLILPAVEMGTVPEYIGEIPTRPDDEKYTYTFLGWVPQVVAATKDATYRASYSTKRKTEDIVGVKDGTVGVHKILHNGQILILRGDKTYTLTGQEIK